MVNSAKWDIYVITGQSYQKSLYFTTPEESILDLTGYTFSLEVKKDKNEPKPIFTLTNGTGITVHEGEGAVVVDVSSDNIKRLYGIKCVYTLKMTAPGGEASYPFVGDIYLNSSSSKTELTGSSGVNVKIEEKVYNIGIADGDIADSYSRNYLDTQFALKKDKTDNVYVDTKLAELVNTAPGTLDTLNELAGALGDDPNFATTMTAQIGTKANTSHTHTKGDITDLDTYQKSEVDILLSAKADQTTTYTKTETDNALILKANQSTTYTKDEINAIKALLDVDVSNRALASGVYTKADVDTIIDGVNTTIGTKANQTTTYTKTEVDTSLGLKEDADAKIVKVNGEGNLGIGKTPSEKLDVNGNIKGINIIGDGSQLTNLPIPTVDAYTESESDALLNAKANQSTTYTKTEVDASLGLKANQSTTYTKTEVDTAIAGAGSGGSTPTYGSMYRDFASSSFLIGGTNSYRKVNNSWNVGASEGVTVSSAGTLTYTGTDTKMFKVEGTLDVENAQGVTEQLYYCKIYKNGSEITGTRSGRMAADIADSVVVQALVSLSQNDYIEIYVANGTNTDDVRIKSANVTMFSI
jgi:hypothetical protein|tara:strand:+ start:13545 stop:15293 length:1749 start_codon:yes stop_codon:yes gene_type:complete